VIGAINVLAENPHPRNSRKPQNREGYRLRIEDYRVLYTVDDDRREEFVAEVWHRQRGYR
jgi:mRNA interferase RelE/StbE